MSVTIGIDPHKSTHTAVAVDRDEHQVARLTLVADRHQTDRLLAWAEPLDADRVWAIESAAGLGRLLAQQLVAAGERVVGCPADTRCSSASVGATRDVRPCAVIDELETSILDHDAPCWKLAGESADAP